MSRFELIPVDLAFSETAEKTYVCEGRLTAGIEEVWRAVADATTWADWFPEVERALRAGPQSGCALGVANRSAFP